MIKKVLLALVLALPLSTFAQKFGVVDLDAIFTAMPEATAMQTQLVDTSKKYEEEYGKIAEELNRRIADFQSLQNDTTTPESIKERRIQEIQELQQKADQFRNTAEQDLARLRETLMTPIQTKLTEAVKAVGAEGGFTFVFPNEPSLLLYTGTDVVNVSDLVRAKLGL